MIDACCGTQANSQSTTSALKPRDPPKALSVGTTDPVKKSTKKNFVCLCGQSELFAGSTQAHTGVCTGFSLLLKRPASGMRACLVFLCLLAATFALSVKSKPHGKHGGLHKTSHTAKEKDIVTEEANKPQILPTLVPLEVSSHEQEDEESSSDDNANANKEDFGVTEGSDKSTAVLLSEEELVDLLKKEAEEEQEAEEIVLEEEEVKTEKGEEESGEIIEDEVEEKTLDDKLEREEDAKEEEEEKEESVEDAELLEKEEVEVEKDRQRGARGISGGNWT
ncbi:hypothetical protein E3U43_008188 [Larimichthys crocea]|uniref:Uncharacterized protein n=1 Tax=Larimichthys crocea TaxID=215358 RepID=A0ACD3RTC7_LARCR|nr:hypothetical protein E3U43_008188 [Larimichthys crocea]